MQQTPPSYVPRRLRRERRHPIKVTILAVAMVLACVAGVGGAYAAKLNKAFDSAKVVAKEDVLPTYSDQPYKDPGDQSMNVLLLGADKSETGAELDLTASGTDQRSDSMMLVHIPEGHDHVYVMSIMRDTYVTIPGVGSDKINAALEYGGVPKLRETIEKMLDVQIDHVAAVDFDGFKELTKAIGGVTVNNPKAFCAYKTTPDVCFEAGKIHIQGNRALKWVRERHAFATSDYQRVKNQQQFLKAVVSKVLSAEVMSSPNKIADVLASIMPSVTMDSGLADKQMLIGLAMQMKDIRGKDIRNFTLPNAGTGQAGGASVVLNSPEWNLRVGNAMEEGTMEELYEQIPADFKGK
ncbi:MAG: LCP family protein [Arthrobacter sp.]|nr:LCP family protein [Arthrobacter sp.]